MYTINLSNGLTLSSVRQNGDLLLTSEGITREQLEGGLGRVEITGKPDVEGERDYSGTYRGLKLGYYRDGGTMREFILRQLSEGELAMKKLEANMEYVAMMVGVSL